METVINPKDLKGLKGILQINRILIFGPEFGKIDITKQKALAFINKNEPYVLIYKIVKLKKEEDSLKIGDNFFIYGYSKKGHEYSLGEIKMIYDIALKIKISGTVTKDGVHKFEIIKYVPFFLIYKNEKIRFCMNELSTFEKEKSRIWNSFFMGFGTKLKFAYKDSIFDSKRETPSSLKLKKDDVVDVRGMDIFQEVLSLYGKRTIEKYI